MGGGNTAHSIPMAKEKNVDEAVALLAELGEYGVQIAPTIVEDIDVVPTGFPGIDNDILKIGGLPLGKIVEISGPPEVGKSFLAYQILTQAQRRYPDKWVALIDTEFVVDRRVGLKWVEKQGVNLAKFALVASSVAEEVFNTFIAMVESGKFSVVVLDSLGNTEAGQFMAGSRFQKDAKTGAYKTDQIGVLAKIIGNSTKRLVTAAANTKTLLVIINQVRDNMNVMYGPKHRTPGGNVFKHNRSIGIELVKLDTLKRGESIEGQVVRAHVRRSKVSTAGSTSSSNDLRFYFGDGAQDRAGVSAVVDRAIELGVIGKKGAWMVFGQKKFMGLGKLLDALSTDPDLLLAMEQEVAMRASEKPDNAYEAVAEGDGDE